MPHHKGLTIIKAVGKQQLNEPQEQKCREEEEEDAAAASIKSEKRVDTYENKLVESRRRRSQSTLD